MTTKLRALAEIARTGLQSTDDMKVDVVPLTAKASDYLSGGGLKAPDLDGDTEVTINGMDQVTYRNDLRPKLVLTFEQFPNRTFTLNKTNTQILEHQLGGDLSGWFGKTVTLYPTSTFFEGKNTPTIRIREV